MLNDICRKISEAGGRALLVGGCVRDRLQGQEPKDFDVEVYRISAEKLVEILEQFGKVDAVGKSFGVLKLGQFDFSLPRRENKQGKGHKGFQVEPDESMTECEAAKRRDFTINSMALDPLTDELLDFHQGQRDLRERVLRPTSVAFAEDALRVLRGMQFAARFDMTAHPDFCMMAVDMMDEFRELSVERLWGEWEKLLTKGSKPSRGLNLLVDTRWICLFPAISALAGCPQDKEWHPEGDALLHTCHVMDAAATIAERERLNATDRCVLLLAALCHDFGKPSTTVFECDHWRSPGHDLAGIEPTTQFLKQIGCPLDIREKVLKLVRWHMVVVGNAPTDKSVKRLSVALEPCSIEELCRLLEADHSGRPPLEGGLPANAKLLHELAVIQNVCNGKVKPLLMGRHLIELGMKPGPAFGKILAGVFELQIDGVITTLEDAIRFVRDG